MTNYYCGDDLIDRLRITRNVALIPEVYKPAGNLVVSASVRAALRAIPTILFYDIEYEKLVDVHFAPGDFAYFDRFGCLTGWELFARCKPVEPTVKMPKYYEMIVPNYYRLAQTDEARIRYVVPAPESVYRSPLDIELSPGLLEQFPIIWTDRGFLFTQSAFQKIDAFIDRTYFDVTSGGPA